MRADPVLDSLLLAELLDQLALQGPDLLQNQLVPGVGEGGAKSFQVLMIKRIMKTRLGVQQELRRNKNEKTDKISEAFQKKSLTFVKPP